MYSIGMEPQKRDVVIYGRVSTEHEAQKSALGNQLDWYKPILASHPEWTLVHTYVDEGITGTSAEKRPQFLQMIRDAKKRKFDLIITREVSRFARNTVDTLQYTRELKAKGVEVYFLNDNIKTFDCDGELRLTIMATLAQDESRKTSVRVKSGQQTSMENGVFYGNGNILGYDRVGKSMVQNPEQAETVRMIFDMYLNGVGITKIAYTLEQKGRKTAMGKNSWHCTVISHVLKNSFYCGIITYHKEYTPDYLTQKKIKNYGEVEKLQVVGTHEPIITVEKFEKVQRIMESRSQAMSYLNSDRKNGKKPNTTVWGKLMICSCGQKFNRRTWNRKDGTSNVGYICYTTNNRGSLKTRINKGLSTEIGCDIPQVPEWKLEMMAKYIFSTYIKDAPRVLGIAEQILIKHINDKCDVVDNSDKIKRLKAELSKLNKKADTYVEMRADGEISKEVYKSKSEEIAKKIEFLISEISALENLESAIKDNKDDCEERLSKLKKILYAKVDFDNVGKISENVVDAFIERIEVTKDGFNWYLRCSPEVHRCSVSGRRSKSATVEENDQNEDSESHFASSSSGSYQGMKELS